MAFFSRSDRLLPIQDSPSVGPGAYSPHTSEPRTLFAPFMSTSQKSLFLPAQTHKSPGPGSYFSQPFSEASPKLSSAFASQSSRFKTKEATFSPGPGSYQKSESWTTLKKEQVPFPKVSINLSPSVPSIPASHQSHGYQQDPDGNLVMQKSKILGFTGKKTDCAGPGEYEIREISKNPAATWHKAKATRELNLASKTTSPSIGPGSYSLKKAKKISKKSIFASNCERSFTHESVAPGPGAYRTKLSSLRAKASPGSIQNFGSNSPRFAETDKVSDIGPGSYSSDAFQNTRHFSNAPFHTTDSRFRLSSKETPGPGSYEKDDVLALSKASFLQGGFGSTEKRFEDTKAETPGPGQYKTRVKKSKKMNAVFLSKTQRSELADSKSVPPPGFYEVNLRFGASQKEGKLGFFSGTRRFLEKDKKEEVPGPGSYDYGLKKGPGNTIISHQTRFKGDKKNVPGPGEYGSDYIWKKKSFNVLFSERE